MKELASQVELSDHFLSDAGQATQDTQIEIVETEGFSSAAQPNKLSTNRLKGLLF